MKENASRFLHKAASRWLVFAIGIAIVVLGEAFALEGQRAPRVFRIGFLANTVPMTDLVGRVPSHPGAIAVEDGLRKLGWIDGKNIEIVWKSAEGKLERLPDLAEELVRIPVDVIVAFGPGVAAAAQKTRSIPIVMATSSSPVEQGLVKSLARPGGNVTGLTLDAGMELNGKRLALLKAAVPKASRVAFVVQHSGPLPEDAGFSPQTQGAAQALGLTLFLVTFAAPEDLERTFADAVRHGANALVFPDTPILYWRPTQDVIKQLAVRHRLPAMHSILVAPEMGALMAYAPNIMVNYQRAPYYIDRILRGAKPADLPIEQPSKFELVVNLKAAKAIGLTIPASVLTQADRVIE